MCAIVSTKEVTPTFCYKPLLEKLEVTMMKRAPYRARDEPYN